MCEINAVFLHAMRAPHRCGIFPSRRPEKKSPVKLVCVGLRNGQAGVRVSKNTAEKTALHFVVCRLSNPLPFACFLRLATKRNRAVLAICRYFKRF